MKKFNKILSIALLFLIVTIIYAIPVKADTVYSGHVYKIMSLSNSIYLDVEGNASANGTNIQVYKANATNAQRFYIEKVCTDSNGTEWYKIQNLNGKVLDVTNGSTASNTNVQLYEWNGSDAQLWSFANNAQGYRIISKLGNYLDVDGNNIQVNKSQVYGTKRQRFAIYQMSNTDPYGYVDSITSIGNRKINVSGWTFDWDSINKNLSYRLKYKKNGSSVNQYTTWYTANSNREDVNNVYAGVGEKHGFNLTIKLQQTGNYTVYVQVKDSNTGKIITLSPYSNVYVKL